MGYVVLPLLALLASSGAAGACSLAKSAPGPGAFLLWSPDDGIVGRLDVAERELGTNCELANTHAMDDRRVAWTEDGRFLHVRGLDDGVHLRVTMLQGPVTGLSLQGDHVVALVASTGDVISVNVTDGSQEVAWTWDVDVDVTVATGGTFVAVVEPGDDAPVLSVFDVHERTWPLEEESLDDLGLPEGARLAAAGEDGMVFADARAHWVVRWPGDDETVERLPAVPVADLQVKGNLPWLLGVDGDRLYFARYVDAFSRSHVHEVNVTAGTSRDLGATPYLAVGGVDDGLVVLGAYAAPPHLPAAARLPPSFWGALAAAAVVVGGRALWRRRALTRS